MHYKVRLLEDYYQGVSDTCDDILRWLKEKGSGFIMSDFYTFIEDLPGRKHVRMLSENAKISQVDMVNRPPHYTQGSIEVIDFLLDQRFDYLAGTVVKYISRYRYKGNPVEDLKKARWYLDKLIVQEESKNEANSQSRTNAI